MVHAAAKYAAGAALSVLLVTALAGVEWLPFSGPRQTLQDLYHHHMLEQQDVTDFRSQPEPSMQDMAGGLIKRAKNWTPSLRILQGPVILAPEETPTDAAAAAFDDATTGASATDLDSTTDAADSPTPAVGGPAGSVAGPAGGPGSSAPNAAPAVTGAPGCVPIQVSSSSSSDADASSPEGSLEGPAAAPVPSAVIAAPAPDGTPQAEPVKGVLCATGTSGGVFVPGG